MKVVPSGPRPLSARRLDGLYFTLFRDASLWHGEFMHAVQRVTRLAAQVMGVDRASIWRFQDGGLACINVYDAPSDSHDAGEFIRREDYPEYFTALELGRIIDAYDAVTDPRTREFAKSYLEPKGIAAMLDATLRAGGKFYGVLCLEHCGSFRLWKEHELLTAMSLGDILAQVILQNELVGNTTRYEALLANMPSVIYRINCRDDQVMEYMSAGCLSLTGCAADVFTGKHPREFAKMLHDSDRGRVEDEIARALQERRSYAVEYRIVDKTGVEHWVAEFSRPVFDALGEVHYIDGVINDITDRKRIETMVASQQDLILHIVNGISGATGEAFFKSLIRELAVALNISYCFIGRYSRENQEMIETLAVYARGGESDNFSYSLDGTPCAVAMDNGICCYSRDVQSLFPDDDLLKNLDVQGYLGVLLKDYQNNPLGLLVGLHTAPIEHMDFARELFNIFAVRAASELERRVSDLALSQSEKRYKALFDSAGDAIFIMSDEVFVDCNRMTLEMFACERGQIVGQTPYQFSPRQQPDGQDSKEKARQMIQTAYGGETLQFEWQHIRLDGKPFDAEVRLTKVDIDGEQHLLAVVRDISERKAADREMLRSRAILEHHARHDSLTNLPNRNALKSKLNVALRAADERGQKVALLLIDLNRFKEVNDTLGHEVGDKLICTVAPRIRESLAGYNEYISRLGGDEFAVLIEGAFNRDDLSLVAEKIVAAIQAPFDVEGISLEIGCGIGISIYPDQARGASEIMRQADVAMYYAKYTVTPCCFYSADIDKHTPEKLATIADFRIAVDADQLELHYQPKIDLVGGKLIGFEALLRWRHPKRGLLFPDQFIELAEMSDLIHPLTVLVIRKALSQMRLWRQRGWDISMAVNVSTRNLLDTDFPLAVDNLLRESGVPANRLELEITESAIISDPVRVRDILNEIAALGVKISVDDFGTGYSSLAYLKQLPIDSLKIDRSFVMDMVRDDQDSIIVKSTVALAHNLDLVVVAEGVESQEILDHLTEMGCDSAQGYYISRPLTLEKLDHYLADLPESQKNSQ